MLPNCQIKMTNENIFKTIFRTLKDEDQYKLINKINNKEQTLIIIKCANAYGKLLRLKSLMILKEKKNVINIAKLSQDTFICATESCMIMYQFDSTTYRRVKQVLCDTCACALLIKINEQTFLTASNDFHIKYFNNDIQLLKEIKLDTFYPLVGIICLGNGALVCTAKVHQSNCIVKISLNNNSFILRTVMLETFPFNMELLPNDQFCWSNYEGEITISIPIWARSKN
jgi:hypothetical protein